VALLESVPPEDEAEFQRAYDEWFRVVHARGMANLDAMAADLRRHAGAVQRRDSGALAESYAAAVAAVEDARTDGARIGRRFTEEPE